MPYGYDAVKASMALFGTGPILYTTELESLSVGCNTDSAIRFIGSPYIYFPYTIRKKNSQGEFSHFYSVDAESYLSPQMSPIVLINAVLVNDDLFDPIVCVIIIDSDDVNDESSNVLSISRLIKLHDKHDLDTTDFTINTSVLESGVRVFTIYNPIEEQDPLDPATIALAHDLAALSTTHIEARKQL